MDLSERDRVDTAFVVKAISEHRNRSDIIMALAKRRGCSWNEAEQFMARTELAHRSTIKKEQSGPLLLLGVGTLVGGGLATILAVYLFMLAANGFYEVGRFALFLSATGPLMVIGGIIGIWGVMRDRGG